MMGKEDKNKELFHDLFEDDPVLGSKPKIEEKIKTEPEKTEKKQSTLLEKFFDEKKEKEIKDDIFLPIPSIKVINKKSKGPAGKEIERKVREFTGETITMKLSKINGEQFLDWMRKHYPENMLAGVSIKDFDNYDKRRAAFNKLYQTHFDKIYPDILIKNIKYKN